MAGEIRKVGVVGLGAMGAGIAQLCVEAGVETVGREITAELGEKARERIAHFLTRKVEKGTLEQDARDAAVARLSLTTDLAALADCDLVIEAIVEELAPKQELFAELERLCRADAVLATNTSALSVTEIASATSTPGRVVGMHFFNPAPLMPLVEIVRAQRSSDEAFETAYAFGERIGKHPIRCHDTPGFVVNRVLIPLLNDCVRVLDEARVTVGGSRRGDEARRRLADGAVRAARPRRSRRARPRERSALGQAARAADGAAAPAGGDGERRPARAQDRPRLLHVRELGGQGQRLVALGGGRPRLRVRRARRLPQQGERDRVHRRRGGGAEQPRRGIGIGPGGPQRTRERVHALAEEPGRAVGGGVRIHPAQIRRRGGRSSPKSRIARNRTFTDR